MKGSSGMCRPEMHIMELHDHMIAAQCDVHYLQLSWSVCWELQLLLAQCEMENDLHWVEPTPGSLPGVHLPQQHPKGVHVNRFAELACMGMPVRDTHTHTHTHTGTRSPLCVLDPLSKTFSKWMSHSMSE